MKTLSSVWTVIDSARAGSGRATAVARRQAERLKELVSYARNRSPFYSELYRSLPDAISDPAELPVVRKSELMSRYDDWATDRDVTIERAEKFAASPERAGELFLGKYVLTTTSGTTGAPGIFIGDERNLAVAKAMALRMLLAWIGVSGMFRIALRGGRIAMTVAPGHTATGVAAAGIGRSILGRSRLLTLPVHRPLREAVERLNAFRPAILAPYASVAALLAEERQAGPDPRRSRRRRPSSRRIRPHRASVRRPCREQLRCDRVSLSQLRLRRAMAARQRRLGNLGAGRCRVPSYPAGRAVPHRSRDQSRQSRAADSALRLGRQRRPAT